MFSGRISGSFSCKYPGVSGGDVNREMVWGVGRRILTFYDKLMKHETQELGKRRLITTDEQHRLITNKDSTDGFLQLDFH